MDELKTILSELIAAKDIEAIKELFTERNIVTIAEAVGDLTVEEAVFLFKVLPVDDSADLFAYLPIEKQQKLVQLLTSSQLKGILEHVYTDDIVDFLQELPSALVKDLLKNTTKENREEINRLLSYPDSSAGSIMTTDYVELKDEDTVAQAMEKIQVTGRQAEEVNQCFVLDDYGALLGLVSLRDILFAPEEEKISELIQEDVVKVYTLDDQEEVSRIMRRYDVTMVPVLDKSQRLVGMITADDIIDIMEEEATEDIHKMAGVSSIDGSYLQTTSWQMARNRLTWLLLLMVSYAFSSMIITANSHLLTALPTLMTFVPMLMDTSGNAGSQALAMVVRGIVVDDLTIKDFFKVLWKEFQVALICGVILFAVNILRIILFTKAGFDMAFVVSLSVFLVVLTAKLVGGLLPLLALFFKQDPAAMASPLITTCCDALSLTIYFTLATRLLF
ncbi:MAG: magnesium transporter [Erysipelotrichaceae bacterium]|jgi:magnesium transporter|nr:magnesium transporter [Erysipelotrichaceae bacterium]